MQRQTDPESGRNSLHAESAPRYAVRYPGRSADSKAVPLPGMNSIRG